MRLTAHRCNFCGRTTFDHYAEKGWIVFDNSGMHIANGRIKGNANVERYFRTLQCILKDESLDFCSLKCFIEWLFLSNDTDNKKSTIEQRKKFMQEVLEENQLKFY